MKKVILSLAVLFSVAMVSCGNKNAQAQDSDSAVVAVEEVAVEEVVVDSAAADSAVVADSAAAPAADAAAAN